MPATSSGRIVKTSKGKKGTLHQKNHRYESFTSKVAKLNALDPLRRVRRHDIDTESLDTTTSYFGAGLEKWEDLNLSAVFVDFLQEAKPLADSLPQIIHFEGKIIDLLITYLLKKDRESVEPLLSLLTDFAHDLGNRFVKHYARALKAIVEIAGIPQDVEVVEWTFTCLAFMFKFLSKHLVSDLRQTFDLVAPLLGKERQPPHIARFAAEALSFLIKKAAAPAVRSTALPLIIKYAKDDLLSLANTRQFELYFHGIMTMFAEAIKAPNNAIHTTGSSIISAMIAATEDTDFDNQDSQIWPKVICGVITSIVHHSTSETFKDIVVSIIEEANRSLQAFSNDTSLATFRNLTLSTRMIGVLAGVRKGSRISRPSELDPNDRGDWPKLLESFSNILDVVVKSKLDIGVADEGHIWSFVGLNAAILLQYAPLEITYIDKILGNLIKDPFATSFLTFCSYIAANDSSIFQNIVDRGKHSYFKRFVTAHWSETGNEDTLLTLVPRLVESGAIFSTLNGDNGFEMPQSWQDQVVSKWDRLEASPFPEQASPITSGQSQKAWVERCLPKYDAILKLMKCSQVHPSTDARIRELLLRKLKLALRPSSTLAPDEAHFVVGRGFDAFCRMSRSAQETDVSLEPLLRAAAPRFARLPNFLSAMNTYLRSLPKPTTAQKPIRDAGDDPLVTSLVENLATESHELRLLSLDLLSFMSNNSRTMECLHIMHLIESTPLDLQSARSASMHIRKLAAMYASHADDNILSKAIPYFCFGMLTVKFAQLWDDASAAIAQIVQIKTGEDVVADLVFQWLEVPSKVWESSQKPLETTRDAGLTDFECSNLMYLQQAASDAQRHVKEARSEMTNSFEAEQKQINARPSTARQQALRVLLAVPQLAEKRSRLIMPMFLSWASKDRIDDDQQQSDWTRKDQKALLDILALFHNPRVLFRATEVHAALLSLLASGDLETQKSALKAIFTWKIPGVKLYNENLQNLLDEARFKDEITVLLGGDTLIQPDHREELMPVLLRLLYGRTISRKGAASGKGGMEATRLVVLRNLNITDTGSFLDLALGDLKIVDILGDASVLQREILTVRKQVGAMHMLEVILKEMASQVAPFTKDILSAVLYCLIRSSDRLQGNFDMAEEDEASQTSMLKVIRSIGFKCLVLLFTNDSKFPWSAYIPLMLERLIGPRLDKLPVETAQGVSGIMQLFMAWSSSSETVMFLNADLRIMPKISECVVPPKSQSAVKLFALKIIRNIATIAADESEQDETVAARVREELLKSHMDIMLMNIGGILRDQQDMSKDLLEACVTTVVQLSQFVASSTQAQNLVKISTLLLDQPSRRVDPRTKSGLLEILEKFVPLYNLQEDVELKDKIYNTITSLFGFFKDQKSREVLSRVLSVYAQTDPVLGEVAELCLALNSFKTDQLDSPDYDRRLRAFVDITKHDETPFNAYQWRPILYNMLFYIRHDEEFGILSSSSADGICNFLDVASRTDGEEKADFMKLLSTILLPAIYQGAREQSEVVRREYIKVMAHLIREFSEWSEVSDMHNLLRGEEELESSFFNNILTSNKSRQSSALGLLTEAAEKNELSSRSVGHFFIPLVEHFIFDRAEGSEAHALAAEASAAMGVLAGSLEWTQYRALLRRLIEKVISKPELEKQIIRLLGRVIDALSAVAGSETATSTLATSLPKEEKFVADITNNVLPPLSKYLHDKDESTVSLRVPVAIIIVRLLKLLPEQQLNERLPAVLTDICHILRSKEQVSRDLTRDTLVKICFLLGPSCFGFILKELRGALARGYQLHVLSYTMHSMLVAAIPEYKPGDLDYCLSSIVAIIMDDIFGATGQEKDAEEYTSKMKEVKSSKSHDSMELIARTATLSQLTILVRPIQVLLKERLDTKMVRKIDELLNRISAGLLKNAAADSRDSLVFCYEVINDVYKSAEVKQKSKDDYRLKKYLIQKGAKKSGGGRSSTTVYTYKLVRFAFDVMRTVLRKHDSLRVSSNLTGFIPIIGDAIGQAEDEIKVAAFKLLTTLVKVPFKNDDGVNLYRIAAVEATRCVTAATSTTSDLAQASLKLLSVILRDRKDIETIKDSSIDQLLEQMKDDLTEPERRHVTFNFLRSVLDAKIQSAMVYDTMDHVGTVMVTNDDKDTRDLARGAYFQFLREYPQMKKRWTKQLGFIISNLKYEREGGRLSVLEVIHLLLSKSSSDFTQEVASNCFVPLVFVLVNDESEKCRMAAGEVIKEIFRKSNAENTKTFLGLLRTWLQQVDNPSVLRLAFQNFGFYYEVNENADTRDVATLQKGVYAALQTEGNAESDWEMIYSALQLTSTLVGSFTELMLAKETAKIWTSILNCLSYPHAWVKLSAAKLAGIYFADFARTNAETGFALPLTGSQGLTLQAEHVQDLIRRSANMFKTPGLTELLATEIVKNLVFLGRVADASNLIWKSAKTNEDAESEDDADADANARTDGTALHFLFSRLSFILRRESSPPRAPVLIPKTYALQLMTHLCHKLSPPTLLSLLSTILLPLHNLTDPSIPIPYSTDEVFRQNYETLRQSCTDLMTSLQTTLGTQDYTKVLLKVRENVKKRRNARLSKRRIEAVAEPEKYGADKRKKVERKKERRKERGAEHKQRRHDQ